MIHDGIIESVRIPTRRGNRGTLRVKHASLERLVNDARPAPSVTTESILNDIRREHTPEQKHDDTR